MYAICLYLTGSLGYTNINKLYFYKRYEDFDPYVQYYQLWFTLRVESTPCDWYPPKCSLLVGRCKLKWQATREKELKECGGRAKKVDWEGIAL